MKFLLVPMNRNANWSCPSISHFSDINPSRILFMIYSFSSLYWSWRLDWWNWNATHLKDLQMNDFIFAVWDMIQPNSLWFNTNTCSLHSHACPDSCVVKVFCECECLRKLWQILCSAGREVNFSLTHLQSGHTVEVGTYIHSKIVDSLKAWLGGKRKTGFGWIPASQAMSEARIFEWKYPTSAVVYFI